MRQPGGSSGKKPWVTEFSMPPLPKPWYEWVKGQAQQYELPKHIIIMAGLLALEALSKSEPERYKALIEEAKGGF